jgi:hypothetical protein
MRIPRQITDFLGSLFAPANREPRSPGTSILEDTPKSSASFHTDQSGSKADRISLSTHARAAAEALASPASPRLDVPSVALPDTTSHATDSYHAAGYTGNAEESVKALVPVTASAPVFSQQATDAAQGRETPETRRMVRAVYGYPQASEPRESISSGAGIRIRV